MARIAQHWIGRIAPALAGVFYHLIFSVVALICAAALVLGVPTIRIYCAAVKFIDSLIDSIQKHT